MDLELATAEDMADELQKRANLSFVLITRERSGDKEYPFEIGHYVSDPDVAIGLMASVSTFLQRMRADVFEGEDDDDE